MTEAADIRARLERCATECAERGWRLAFALLQHREDAADCVQQAFVVATRKPHRVPADDPWPWLAAVIAHEARNTRRKRARLPLSLDPGADMPLENRRSADPAAQAQDRERDAALVAALGELPEPEREALLLTQVGGLTYAGAAGALGVPEGTLNGRISRALEKLRRRLGKGDAAILGCIPLLPVAPPPLGFKEQLLSHAASAAVATPSIIIAGVAMKKTTALAALLVVVLLLGISAVTYAEWPVQDAAGGAPVDNGRFALAAADTRNGPANALTSEARPVAAGDTPATQDGTDADGNAAPAEVAFPVSVLVRDELTSRPVPGAKLVRGVEDLAATDNAGKAEVFSSALTAGVTVRAEGYIESKVGLPRAGTTSVSVWLAPVYQGRGLVLDATGAPAPGARVLLGSRYTPEATAVRGGVFETRAGADGSFMFPVSSRERDAMATLPENFHAADLVLSGQCDLTLRLAPARGIDVFLEGPGTTEIKTLILHQPPWPATTAPVSNGRAQFRCIGLSASLLLTTPDRPDAWWDVDLDRHAAITPYFIYLDDATITLRVKWLTKPARPIASVHVAYRSTYPASVAGKVVSQDTFVLPYHLVPLHGLSIRFMDAEGRIAGFASGRGSSLKSVSDTEWECEGDATHFVGGRIVDATGSPVSGCGVRTQNGGISAFRNGEAVTGPDGRFEVNIDNRHEVRLRATDGANFADVSFEPNCKSFGDVVLAPRRTIRTYLKGAKSDEMYFVCARDFAYQGGPAPLLCRAGEFVDVPVTDQTLAIQADGLSAFHVKRLAPQDRETVIDLDAGPLTVRLLAFEEDVQTKQRKPLAGRRLRVHSGVPERKTPPSLKIEDSPFWETAAVRIVTTDESGRVTIAGIQPGRLEMREIDDRSMGGDRWADITTDGQQVDYCVPNWSRILRFNLVPVIGRISPLTGRQYLRLVSLNAPLPKPMELRATLDGGLKAAMVHSLQFRGGGFAALMDPAFPYIAAETAEGSETEYNAGYLTKVGDIWRADIVLPSGEDETKAKLVVTDGGLGASSLQLKVVWTEDGKARGRGAHVELGKECEIAWPESARDVRLFLTAEAGERRLAAMVTPRADTVNRVALQVMPPVKLTNTAGLTGQLSLTPTGINEREWRDVQTLAKDASKLRLFGSGQYELASKDASGKVRTKTISILIRDDTPVIEIDPRSVLQPKEE